MPTVITEDTENGVRSSQGVWEARPLCARPCHREIFIFHTEAALPRLPAHTEPFFALEPLHTCLLSSPRTQRMECAARRESGKRALCVPGPVIGKFSFSTLRPRFPDCQHTLNHFSRWSPCTHAYCHHRGHREWSAQLAGSLGSAPFVCQALSSGNFHFPH